MCRMTELLFCAFFIFQIEHVSLCIFYRQEVAYGIALADDVTSS